MPSIEIEGLNEFTLTFDEAAQALREGIAEALQNAGDAFVDSAQGAAPVDTGFLQDNIAITSTSDTEVVIESLAEYSLFVEEGTWKMTAQPYFFQALDSAQSELEAAMANIEL
jgi:HK97 gp10 family phage protein